MPLTLPEENRIAVLINPIFADVLAQYDFGKYPANSYQSFKNTFSKLPPKNGQISDALLWKWGKSGQNNYPQSYTNLIAEISGHWGDFVRSGATATSQETFEWWNKTLHRKTTFITEAYITHLVHHTQLPIIDQHNFRAMNYLKSKVRVGYRYKKKPSNWNDIQSLKQFMDMLLRKLPNLSFGDLDRFLMMYGRNQVPR